MSGTNFKNFSFLIVLILLLLFTFAYSLFSPNFDEPIYTGANKSVTGE